MKNNTHTTTNRDPREIIRRTATNWFEAKMEAMSDSDRDSTRAYLRSRVAGPCRLPSFPKNEPFRRLVVEILAHVDKLTAEEQRAVELYLTESGTDAALTIQLALG